MSDTANVIATSSTDTTESPSNGVHNVTDTTATAGQTFTPQQVEQIVRDRLARASKAKAPKEPEAVKSSDGVAELRAQIERLTLENTFAKTSAGHQLTGDQREVIESLFLAHKPENPSEWFSQTISKLGLAKPAASTQATGEAMANHAKQVVAAAVDRFQVSAVPAPSAVRDPANITDPRTLTKDDVARLGDRKVREIVDEWAMRNGGGNFLQRRK